MATPLQTLINEAALYIKAELTTTGTPAVYDTDSAVIVNRLISGINDAKRIIASIKYPLYVTEDITLDENSSFTTADTTNVFYDLVSVTYDGEEINTALRDSVIVCDAPASATVSVKYQYIPADMLKLKNLVNADTDDAYCFPDVVDYRILCYRAAQTYYEINGGSSALRKAEVWGRKFNDALRVRIVKEDTEEVIDYYGFGGMDGLI
jgi:hypothetical protein